MVETSKSSFHDFVRSPFFTKDKKLVDLYEHFKTCRVKKTNRLQGAPICRKTFGSKLPDGINQTTITKVTKKVSDLTRLIKKFKEVIGEETPPAPIVVSPPAVKEFISSPLFGDERNISSIILVKLQDWWSVHQSYFGQVSLQFKKDGDALVQASETLLDFARLCLLLYFSEFKNRSNMLNEPLDLNPRFKRALYWVLADVEFKTGSEKLDSLTKLYLKLIDVFYDRMNVNVLEEIRILYEELEPDLLQIERFIIIKWITNTWIHLGERGVKEAKEKTFHWYGMGVDQEVFIQNERIGDNDYLNLVLSAAAIGNYKVQLTWMNNYRKYLLPQHRDKAYYLAMSFLHFFSGEYEKAIALLHRYFPKYIREEVNYTLRSKSLLLKILLVQVVERYDYTEEFKAHWDAFRHFVDRKDVLSKDRRVPYVNFVSFANDIFRLKEKSFHKPQSVLQRDVKELKSRIQKAKGGVISRDWLLDVLDKIK